MTAAASSSLIGNFIYLFFHLFLFLSLAPINKYGPLVDHIPFYKYIPDNKRPPIDQYWPPKEPERPPTDQHGPQTDQEGPPIRRRFGRCPPLSCSPPETSSKDGGACQLTCRQPRRISYTRCSFGCRCKMPFVRNEATGECVRPLDCPDWMIDCWHGNF